LENSLIGKVASLLAQALIRFHQPDFEQAKALEKIERLRGQLRGDASNATPIIVEASEWPVSFS